MTDSDLAQNLDPVNICCILSSAVKIPGYSAYVDMMHLREKSGSYSQFI